MTHWAELPSSKGANGNTAEHVTLIIYLKHQTSTSKHHEKRDQHVFREDLATDA